MDVACHIFGYDSRRLWSDMIKLCGEWDSVVRLSSTTWWNFALTPCWNKMNLTEMTMLSSVYPKRWLLQLVALILVHLPFFSKGLDLNNNDYCCNCLPQLLKETEGVTSNYHIQLLYWEWKLSLRLATSSLSTLFINNDIANNIRMIRMYIILSNWMKKQKCQ